MRLSPVLFLLLPAIAIASVTPPTTRPAPPVIKEAPIAATDDGCKVYAPEDTPKKAVWTGPCKDGFAEGEGTLQWTLAGKKDVRYQGVMKAGRYHGLGYTMSPDNTQYEGEFVAGRREGYGIQVSPTGDRYDGHWKGGIREGQGKMVYALGGTYEGAWATHTFHGKGTIIYAGGRRAEYNFIDGNWPDKIVRVPRTKSYSIGRNPGEVHIGSFLGKGASNLPLPPHLSYEQLSAEDKRAVAASYPLMDPADEPPYYASGPQHLYKNLMKFRNMGEGNVTVLVTVGPNGEAQSVKLIGSPSPEATKIVGHLFMQEKYKPGKCAGKPCTMMLQAAIHFTKE